MEEQIILAADIKHPEETDWEPDISLRGGLQIEDPHDPDRRFQVLLEYFTGRSPTGQFYTAAPQILTELAAFCSAANRGLDPCPFDDSDDSDGDEVCDSEDGCPEDPE